MNGKAPGNQQNIRVSGKASGYQQPVQVNKKAPGQQHWGLRLELDQASLTYQSGTPFAATALKDVSLLVEPGDRLAIAGPVGSGKSTLLSVLAGVEPAASGRILHGTMEIARRHPPAPGSIGLAFQSPEYCLFEKTVFDDVAFAPRQQGLAGIELRERVETALTIVGMDAAGFGRRNPFSLSMGEQRRVALAGVLAMKPRALLFDEPTAHIDPAGRRDLIDRLVRLNEESGVTLVMVGHDMDELARFAGRLVIMDGGRKVADSAAAEILTDATLLARHRLDPPGTVELCGLLAEASGSAVAPVLDEQEALELLLSLMKGKG